MAFEGGGLVLFMDVAGAMRAEKVLKTAGYATRLVAPPPELRKGCDLALEVNLAEQLGIERTLEQSETGYVGVTPHNTGTSELLQVVKVTDFGNWIMVRAGNMKLTFERRSGIIVNISGGGCPDIPHLHAELIDGLLSRVPRPRDIGFTLCARMLDRALEEALALWPGDSRP